MILIVTLNPCIDKTIYIQKNFFGKIIKAEKVKSIAGGKGNNVARVLNELGVKNLSLNFIGGHYGEIIRELLDNDGINYEYVKIKDSSRNITTVLEDNYRQTVYVETSPHISDSEKEEMMKLFKKSIIRYRDELKLVIISGSIPSDNCLDIYSNMIIIAKDYNIKTVLDTSGKALNTGINAEPFMIKPNLTELKDIFSKKLNFDTYKEKELLPLFKKLNKKIEIIILTLEKQGALAFIKDKVFKILPPEIKTINSVGSGDAFIGGFAYGIYKDMQFLDCIRIGIAAGAANAQIWDACFCTKDQIFNLVNKVMIKELD
jgi:tagatose 6-phosphate kinase